MKEVIEYFRGESTATKKHSVIRPVIDPEELR